MGVDTLNDIIIIIITIIIIIIIFYLAFAFSVLTADWASGKDNMPVKYFSSNLQRFSCE